MSFEQSFCPSPWFHMHIDNQGNYSFCRWAEKHQNFNPLHNIRTMDPLVYFQKEMSNIRLDLLNGSQLKDCNQCDTMDKHKKISGRARQQLKAGIFPQYFKKSLYNSPWINAFSQTLADNGYVDYFPVDWQIGLGNLCNSACIFCVPTDSSKLALELKKLGIISTIPKNSWSDDPTLLKKFINTLTSIPNLRFLQFIGGETLINPAFKKILISLLDNNITDLSIGFTTNLTVWDDEIIKLLKQFNTINVGLSIEALHPVNDYVRYPSNINNIKSTLDKWVWVSNDNNWLVQLRITPTLFTVMFLDTIYDYAYENNLVVESCNFLERPVCLRVNVLNAKLRKVAIAKLTNWINSKGITDNAQVLNIRNPQFVRTQLVQDALSYVNYLQEQPYETESVFELVDYIKKLESNRKNSILDYVPEYEEFLRSTGY